MKKVSVRLLENREIMYCLLSRLYIQEVDENLEGALKKMEFPTSSLSKNLEEGYLMIMDYMKEENPKRIEELAVEYARIFLAAGEAHGFAAFPYESAYMDKGRLLMQEPREEVSAIYLTEGRNPREQMFRIPEDHIGLEFSFMAYLCKKAGEAESDQTVFEKYEKAQKEFLEKHLLKWYDVFCNEMERYSSSGFYKGVSKVTQGFMEQECVLIKEFGDTETKQ